MRFMALAVWCFEAGVDGLIGVAAGAGGHAGVMSPFALIAELRQIFAGALVLSGAMTTGAQIAAARLMGADMAYLGTRFLATREAMVPEAYKEMVVTSRMADVLYTPAISGVGANFLIPSIRAAGLDPDNLAAGQGVGSIADLPPAADLCARLIAEYRMAMRGAAGDPFVA
jgi:nitronate monooxygenase